MSMLSKRLPLLTIILAVLFYLQQYMFTLRIPFVMFTPLIGMIGLCFALRLPKNSYRTAMIIANIVITGFIPVYLLLTSFFPGILV